MTPSTPPDIAAVVVTHDSSHVLYACLKALVREGFAPIVVDNASRDGSATIARAHVFGARVIEMGWNAGFGRANNRGVAASRDARWCLLINPDAVLEPGAGDALREAIARWPEAGMLAPRIIEDDGRVFFQPRSLLAGFLTNPSGIRHEPQGDCCVPFVSGAAMLVERSRFEALGGFDEAIFLFYEDDDLCRRMTDRGWPIIWVQDAVVRHARGGSSRSRTGKFDFARAALVRHHQAWSRGYVSRKWGLPDTPLRFALVNGLKLLLAALMFNRRRVARYWGSLTGNLAAARIRPTPRP